MALLPETTNAAYRGSVWSAVYLGLTGLLTVGPGCIHYFLPDGGAGVIAGLDLSRDRAAQIRQDIPDHDPEDKPGSIGPGQKRAIEAQLGMLGYESKDRAGRHAEVDVASTVASICEQLGDVRDADGQGP